jgi:hypothetical protein
MFAFVLPTGLVLLLHPFQFAVRLLEPLPLICMMVSLSCGLVIFLDATLLLHFVVSYHIFLYHWISRFCT